MVADSCTVGGLIGSNQVRRVSPINALSSFKMDLANAVVVMSTNSRCNVTPALRACCFYKRECALSSTRNEIVIYLRSSR